jgi:c-di-GMP-binding flagellar brake protein YcgR
MTRPNQPPSTPSPTQRRLHARLDLRMSAEIRTARSVFTATTRDLSEGGAGLDAERALEEGEEVALGLFLVIDDVETDTPPLWVKARVAWISETDDGHHTAGVRFEVITPEQQAWLRHVLGQLAGPAQA